MSRRTSCTRLSRSTAAWCNAGARLCQLTQPVRMPRHPWSSDNGKPYKVDQASNDRTNAEGANATRAGSYCRTRRLALDDAAAGSLGRSALLLLLLLLDGTGSVDAARANAQPCSGRRRAFACCGRLYAGTADRYACRISLRDESLIRQTRFRQMGERQTGGFDKAVCVGAEQLNRSAPASAGGRFVYAG